MTLIYTQHHVDQLISEIATEWLPNDPDMHRVADAFPLEVLEKAYLKKALEIESSQNPFAVEVSMRHVAQLRVAGTFSFEVLENAYLKRIMDLLPETPPGRARTIAQKFNVMRRIFRAWLREPQLRIGQLVVAALRHDKPEYSAEDVMRRLFYQEDSALADLIEARYPTKK